MEEANEEHAHFPLFKKVAGKLQRASEQTWKSDLLRAQGESDMVLKMGYYLSCLL